MNETELATRIDIAKCKVRLTWYEEQLVRATKQLVSLLRQLRDDPLKPYLATHPSFEAYLLDRWGISARRQRQLLSAEDTRLMLADEAPDLAPVVEAMPERQVRELVQTPPAKRIEVLRKAIEISPPSAKRTTVRPDTAATIKRARAIVIDGATGEPETAPVKRCPHCGKEIE